jgi:DNA-binding transcriptional regulator LsrR (DeoR family)
MKRGPKLATGRYATRGELVASVWSWYDLGHRQAQIARICRVSETTVANILKAGRPQQ